MPRGFAELHLIGNESCVALGLAKETTELTVGATQSFIDWQWSAALQASFKPTKVHGPTATKLHEGAQGQPGSRGPSTAGSGLAVS